MSAHVRFGSVWQLLVVRLKQSGFRSWSELLVMASWRHPDQKSNSVGDSFGPQGKHNDD